MIQYFYVVLYQQRLWLSSIIITNFRCQWKPLDRWRSVIQVCVCVCTNINSHRKPKDKSSSIKWTKADFPMAISLIIKNKVLYKIQTKNIKSKRKKRYRNWIQWLWGTKENTTQKKIPAGQAYNLSLYPTIHSMWIDM